jgi:hypothetical protein
MTHKDIAGVVVLILVVLLLVLWIGPPDVIEGIVGP